MADKNVSSGGGRRSGKKTAAGLDASEAARLHSGKPRKFRQRAVKQDDKVVKRGQLGKKKAAEDDDENPFLQSTGGKVVVGLLIFVVVGSVVLELISTLTSGSRN